MNEEIRQLADQCFMVDTQGNISANEYMIERFANLIIQECVQVLVNRNAPNVYGEHIGVEEIKQHFGVK